MGLEEHILDNMFDKSLFSDLSLAFYHSAFPFTMSFSVHKAMVAQSPFFRHLLNNTHRIPTASSLSRTSSAASSTPTSSQQGDKAGAPAQGHVATLHLTIDLIDAMTRRGFVMAPFQHIIRRQWQKPMTTVAEEEAAHTSSGTNEGNGNGGDTASQHILSTHVRFVLRWLYSMQRGALMDTLEDEHTLRVLCMAILFDLDALVDACLDRYKDRQLTMESVNRDLEIICQLPRDHRAYHQLRDAALLLLLRNGPQHPALLARLPVDYMSDILSADLLFVSCEYERYCLLREVLIAFMHSIGKITWTQTGPIDQERKRLSGFINRLPAIASPKHNRHQITASDVRFSNQRKRKRIPSEDLLGESTTLSPTPQKRALTRLSFSACVPFEKLVADASSGGILDKATILSYLLRTTVIYSNMSFDQLTMVRQDGIVDETVVFRALWQRESLDRLLYPAFDRQTQRSTSSSSSSPTMPASAIPIYNKKLAPPQPEDTTDRHNALNEYFDVDGATTEKEKRRRILLGTPRTRFCASVVLDCPFSSQTDSWQPVTLEHSHTHTFNAAIDASNDDSASEFADLQDDDDAIMEFINSQDAEPSDHPVDTNAAGKAATDAPSAASPPTGAVHTLEIGNRTSTASSHTQTREITTPAWRKFVYSDSEHVLGHWYRVRVEATAVRRPSASSCASSSQPQAHHDAHMTSASQNTSISTTSTTSASLCLGDYQLHCRFDLQRDGPSSVAQRGDHEATSSSTSPSIMGASNPAPKIRYTIYCLKRHQATMPPEHIDPEDRVFVPVSQVTEMEQNDDVPTCSSTAASLATNGYVSTIKMEFDDLKTDQGQLNIDMMVALEVFGLQQEPGV